MGKTVIVVNDGPGFFTSRVLGTMLNEAAWMLAEGASIEQVDRAMTRWGWPVGPFALMDEVGLDVGAHVGEMLQDALGDRVAPPPIFAEDDRRQATRPQGQARLLPLRRGREGEEGREAGRPGRLPPARLAGRRPSPDQEIVERCWLQMLNETARCMEEGIITNPADVDIGVIFGFGFPPFRGGLLREADRHGPPLGGGDARRATPTSYGDRLRPAELLREMARRGEKFYK